MGVYGFAKKRYTKPIFLIYFPGFSKAAQNNVNPPGDAELQPVDWLSPKWAEVTTPDSGCGAVRAGANEDVNGSAGRLWSRWREAEP